MADYPNMQAAQAPDECPPWVRPPELPAVNPDNITAEAGFDVKIAPSGAPVLLCRWVGQPWFDALPSWGQVALFWVCYIPLLVFAALVKALQVVLGCFNPIAIWQVGFLSVLGFLDRWLGVKVPFAVRTMEEQLNTLCPVEVLSPAEANACYLTGTISYDLWTCYVNAAGYKESVQADVVYAGRAKPDARENLINLKRDYLTDLSTYDALQRQVGFIETTDLRMFEWANEQWAPITDVIRFMVRDTADESVVEKYGYDKDFGKKLKGEVQRMYKANNMPDWIAKHYWRSHWELPSNTALYEMLHRQRPERTDGGPVTTADDVRNAIEVNDMAPFWVPRLMDISYNVLTRVDTYRAFQIDVINRDQVKATLQDQGYKEADAETLTQFYESLKRRWQLAQAGAPTAKDIAHAYRDMTINQETARSELKNLKYSDTIIDLTLLSMDEAARRNSTKVRVKGIKRKYTQGYESQDWAVHELAELSLDYTQILDLIGQWEYYRKSGERRPTVSQLCKAYKSGDDDWETYLNRLQRLGYSLDDALRVANQCEDQRLQEELRAEKKAEVERCRPKKKCTGATIVQGGPPADGPTAPPFEANGSSETR